MRAAESTRRMKGEREQQRCWSAGNVTTSSWGGKKVVTKIEKEEQREVASVSLM